jgi:hypothetical protein
MERSTTTCPCAADMPGAENMQVPGFHDDRRWGFSSEQLGITFHGYSGRPAMAPIRLLLAQTRTNRDAEVCPTSGAAT